MSPRASTPKGFPKDQPDAVVCDVVVVIRRHARVGAHAEIARGSRCMTFDHAVALRPMSWAHPSETPSGLSRICAASGGSGEAPQPPATFGNRFAIAMWSIAASRRRRARRQPGVSAFRRHPRTCRHTHQPRRGFRGINQTRSRAISSRHPPSRTGWRQRRFRPRVAAHDIRSRGHVASDVVGSSIGNPFGVVAHFTSHPGVAANRRNPGYVRESLRDQGAIGRGVTPRPARGGRSRGPSAPRRRGIARARHARRWIPWFESRVPARSPRCGASCRDWPASSARS